GDRPGLGGPEPFGRRIGASRQAVGRGGGGLLPAARGAAAGRPGARVKATRLSVLLLTLVVAAAAGYLVTELWYFDLPPLPGFAPVSLLLLAILELGMARVVRDKVRRQSRGRPMHPIQIARAAVLAKASSLGAA